MGRPLESLHQAHFAQPPLTFIGLPFLMIGLGLCLAERARTLTLSSLFISGKCAQVQQCNIEHVLT